MRTRGDGEQEEQGWGGRTPLNLPDAEDREPPERVEKPERYVGYLLLDPLGQKIGKVKRVFTSGRGEPQYMKVKMSWMRPKTLVIPTNRIAVDEALQTLTLL